MQPDTITPGGPQGLNRYSYVLNNPIRHTDPTGHKVTCDADEDCKLSQQLTHLHGVSYWKAAIKGDFGIKMVDDKVKWSENNLTTAYDALSSFNVKLNGNLKTMVGGTTFTMTSQAQCSDENGAKFDCYHGLTDGTGVTFYSSSPSLNIPLINFLHETSHLIDAVPATKDVFSGSLPGNLTWVKNGYVNSELLLHKFAQPVQAKPMNEPNDPDEYWADALANYVAGNIDLSQSAGVDMATDVAKALQPYINP